MARNNSRGTNSGPVKPGTMVRAKNLSDTPFKARYRGQWVMIPGDSEVWIDYAAVVAWFGNPYTVDTPRNKERSREFQRVRLLWMGAENVHNVNLWEERKPKIECYTMDGERFWTVADDPTGQTVDLSTDESGTSAALGQAMAMVRAMAKKLNDQGIEVDLSEFDPVAIRPTGTPERKGSLNQPVILGPETPLNDDFDPDEYEVDGDDSIAPKDDGGIRKVVEVPIDNPRIIQVSAPANLPKPPKRSVSVNE